MVQTRLAKRKTEDPDGVGSTSLNASVVQALESSDEEDPVPKKRRRQTRKTAKKVASSKKRQGGKELCQLNLDVLFLIAEYIHPLDLLNLSRTCRSLRTLLMDKSSTFVWKTARSQVPHLPDCPPDLTEPEYANLVFYARCHGCGKYAQMIFWTMRRRYCPACRLERFIPYSSCDEIMRRNNVLACELFTLDKTTDNWCDKEQVKSFMDEYAKSSDKTKFLQDKTGQAQAIRSHASKCEMYQRIRASEHKNDLYKRRYDREKMILDRLKECGYEAEIRHEGIYEIKDLYPSAFKTSKPLKDKEWDLMRPEWIRIMSNLRERRLESTVYQTRRHTLASEYRQYVQNPPADRDPAYIIPHVADLANLPVFSAITRAPEGTPHDNYASAFAELPDIAKEWTQRALTELAALVEIPSCCRPLEHTASLDQAEPTNGESVPSSTDPCRLQLACAVFRVNDSYACTYSDALSRSWTFREYPRYADTESEPTNESIVGRFGIAFLKDAPYIIRACGLDPAVATADDMDSRNARYTCRNCTHTRIVMSWRTAIHHASCAHSRSSPFDPSNCWQVVSDEHIDAIQAVEQPNDATVLGMYNYARCLLCRQHVGDMRRQNVIVEHIANLHKVERGEIKAGVHFAPVDIRYANGVCSPDEVLMVEEEGKVTFTAK